MIVEKIESIGSFLIVALSSVILSVFLFAQGFIRSCQPNTSRGWRVTSEVKPQVSPLSYQSDPETQPTQKKDIRVLNSGEADNPTSKPTASIMQKEASRIASSAKRLTIGRKLKKSDLLLIMDKLQEASTELEQLKKEMLRVCQGTRCEMEKTKGKLMVLLKTLQQERENMVRMGKGERGKE